MPEGLRPEPLAASRTRSLITVRRHPPAAAKRAPLRPVQNNPRGFGPEIPIQHLAGRGCQTWRGRVLPLVYRNISIQTGEKSKRFYKENFRNIFWDKLPSQTLSPIGALSGPGCCSSRQDERSVVRQISEVALVSFHFEVLSIDSKPFGSVDGSAGLNPSGGNKDDARSSRPATRWRAQRDGNESRRWPRPMLRSSWAARSLSRALIAP
jgi:hypothetical protein